MHRTPSLRLSVCVHFLRLKVILYLDTRLTTDTTYTLLIDKHTQHPHRWADVWSVLEVLTLSHRCNPSVRLRQDVNKAFKSAPQNDWAVSQAKREFVQQTSNNNVTDVREVCLRFVSPQSGRLTHSGLQSWSDRQVWNSLQVESAVSSYRSRAVRPDRKSVV